MVKNIDRDKLIVQLYFKNSESNILAKRAYEKDSKDQISITAIRRIIKKFKETGNVASDRPRSGRPRVRDDKLLKKIEKKLESEPMKSARSISRETGLCFETVRKALREDMNRYPYKVQLKDELSVQNKSDRLDFAKTLTEKTHQRRNRLNVTCIHFSDEANFHLSGHVNKQNTRLWSEENPHATIPKTRTKQKVMVWCAITKEGVLGPFFFDETVTGKLYLQMLRSFYLPAARRKGFDLQKTYFMQDGASVHCTEEVLNFLKNVLGDRVISRRCSFSWPPYSPDLNPLDFFLWGYLKSQVYKAPVPKTVDELKNSIRREIKKLNRNKEIFESVYKNFLTRISHLHKKKGDFMENEL